MLHIPTHKILKHAARFFLLLYRVAIFGFLFVKICPFSTSKHFRISIPTNVSCRIVHHTMQPNSRTVNTTLGAVGQHSRERHMYPNTNNHITAKKITSIALITRHTCSLFDSHALFCCKLFLLALCAL